MNELLLINPLIMRTALTLMFRIFQAQPKDRLGKYDSEMEGKFLTKTGTA